MAGMNMAIDFSKYNTLLEKQYDKMLFEKSGVSIYRVMQSIMEK